MPPARQVHAACKTGLWLSARLQELRHGAPARLPRFFFVCTPLRVHLCWRSNPLLVRSAEVIGIHGNPLRAVPLFLVYLATLMHTYRWVGRSVDRQVGRLGSGRHQGAHRSTKSEGFNGGLWVCPH